MSQIPRAWILIGGTCLGVLTLYVTYAVFGVPVALLVCASVLLVTVVMLMWNSLQALSGESKMTFEEALSLAAPPAEEEQKRAVLRSLKDLEYERRVGKIREDDYQILATGYRNEARVLLGELDARYAPAREKVERELASRIEASSSVAEDSDDIDNPQQDRSGRENERQKAKEHAEAMPKPAKPTRECVECGARNNLEEPNCAECKTPLASSDQLLCGACPNRYERGLAACPQCGVPSEEKT